MRLYLFLAASLTTSPISSAQENSDRISIDNPLSHCIKINKNKTEIYGDFLLLRTTWEIKENTGACGCKSAMLSYNVKAQNNGDSYIAHGLVSSLNKKNIHSL